MDFAPFTGLPACYSADSRFILRIIPLPSPVISRGFQGGPAGPLGRFKVRVLREREIEIPLPEPVFGYFLPGQKVTPRRAFSALAFLYQFKPFVLGIYR